MFGMDNLISAGAGAVAGGLLGGGGGASMPAADPNIAKYAAKNADLATKTADTSTASYKANQARQAAFDKLTQQIVGQQQQIGQQQQQNAGNIWDQYTKTFMPVQQQVATDALNMDSAANQEKAAGQAGSQVAQSYNNAQQQQARRLQSMGINPNSGRALALDNATKLQQAADSASAMNTARTNVIKQGITARQNAASLGLNVANTGNNTEQQALAANGAATATAAAPMNTENQNVATLNSGMGTAIQGNNAAAGALNNQYSTQVNAAIAQNQADASSSAGLGQLAGQIGSAYLLGPAALATSSKKAKTEKSGISDSKTLNKVKSLPVQNWRYKKGVADGGKHTGPYAEDVNKHFGDSAAPGGKAIDMVSMNGITLSAIKGLAKQVDKLQGQVKKIASRGVQMQGA